MAEPIVKLKVEDSSFNAKLKTAIDSFKRFGETIAKTGADSLIKFTKGLQNAKQAQEALNTAIKASLYGMAATAAVEVGKYLYDWASGANAARDAQEKLNAQLENTKNLLDNMKSEADFNIAIAKAAGASSVELAKMRVKAAEARLALADLNYDQLRASGNASTEQIQEAMKMQKEAWNALMEANNARTILEVQQRNKTGEFKEKSSGGRSIKASTDPAEKFMEQWLQVFRKSLATSMDFKAEDGGPSAIWQALQEKADEIKQVDIVSPLQAMRDELKTLTEWRDKAQTPEEWQKRNKAVTAKQNQIKQFTGQGGNETDKKDNKTEQALSNLSNGVNSIVGGINQLGIEIPDELSSVIGSLQAITAIVSGIESLIAVGNFLGIFHTGGVVHAANGFAGKVPGRHLSGDNIPIMADAGEVVLTRAMAGNLASQLNGNALADLNLTATVRGEQLKFSLNANGRRTGTGEYVQTNRRRG